jgi:hypothetical protein
MVRGVSRGVDVERAPHAAVAVDLQVSIGVMWESRHGGPFKRRKRDDPIHAQLLLARIQLDQPRRRDLCALAGHDHDAGLGQPVCQVWEPSAPNSSNGTSSEVTTVSSGFRHMS